MQRLFRTSFLLLAVACAALGPLARAGNWNDPRYTSDLRLDNSPDFLNLNSSFFLSDIGPVWFRNALWSSTRIQRSSLLSYDSSGDRVTYEAGYVGTLRDEFSSDIARFSSALYGMTSRSSSAISLAPNAPTAANTYTWSTTTTGTAWIRSSNWTGGPANTYPGVDLNSSTIGDGDPGDIAQFSTLAFTGNNIGINFGSGTGNGTTANGGANGQLTLGAISILNTMSKDLVIGKNDTSTTTSNLVLNGATVNSVPNVIIRNADDNSLTLAPFAGGSGAVPMKVVLGNATDNIINIDGSGGITISAVIGDGTGNHLSLGGAGTGTLTLSGANTYSGGTTVNSTTLKLSGSGTLGSTTGSLTVNGGKLDLGGTSQTVGAFSGSGGQVINSSGTASTLTVGNGGGSGTYAGSITNTGAIALTKTGAGTITLTSNNSYTGVTTINGGTLELKNTGGVALSGTSRVQINNGGTLLFSANNQLNQAVAPPITLGTVGGTGAAPLISANNTTQGGAGAAGTAGLGALTLNVNSTIDLSGTSVLHFADSTGSAWQTGVILSITNWDGNPLGSGSEQLLFGNNNIPGLTTTQLGQIQFIDPAGFAAGTYSAIFSATDLNEIVPGVPIPEPSTWIGGGLALAAIAWTQRKRFVKRSAKS